MRKPGTDPNCAQDATYTIWMSEDAAVPRCDLKKSRPEVFAKQSQFTKGIEFDREPASGPNRNEPTFAKRSQMVKACRIQHGCGWTRMASKNFCKTKPMSEMATNLRWRRVSADDESLLATCARATASRQGRNMVCQTNPTGDSYDISMESPMECRRASIGHGCRSDKIDFFKYETNEVFS
jgi:hypothetical protein